MNNFWEFLTQKKRKKKLENEFGVKIFDTFFGLILVEKGSMRDRWGLPAVSHDHDWYLIEDIRKKVVKNDETN